MKAFGCLLTPHTHADIDSRNCNLDCSLALTIANYLPTLTLTLSVSLHRIIRHRALVPRFLDVLALALTLEFAI